MKPLDLREWGEQLRVSAPNEIAEFAKEIIELYDGAERTADYDEICEALNEAMPASLKGNEHWRQIEYLTDRDNLLSETENLIPDYADRLKMAGIETKGRALDDIFGDLLERLPTEWDL